MPVRKIPKNYRSITGRLPSTINGRCIGYESKLERDFYLRLEFDPTIESYEEQPLRLTGVVDDRKVSYTPDCLVKFLGCRPARIIEVKYQSELEEKAAELEPRFALARSHAQENGMEFGVETEQEIYAGSIDNYRLLYRFTKPPNHFELKKKKIFESLEKLGNLSLKNLLMSLGADRKSQAEYTTSIWHLLYKGNLEADLNEPIGYHTIIRIPNG